jgi:O-antigen/teichoic acid export membrane protein
MRNRASGSFLSGVFWNAAVMAVLWPLSIVTAIFIGRWLGPAGKGEYTLATLVGTLLYTVLNLGVTASISYFLGGERVAEGSLTKSVISLGTLLGIAAILITWALDLSGWSASSFGVPRLPRAVWLVVLALPFQFVGTFLQFVILARGRRVLFAVLPAVGQVFLGAGIGALVLLESLTPSTAAGALAATQVLTGLILLVYQQRRVRWLHEPYLGLEALRRLTNFSLVSYAGGVFYFLVQRADVFLLGVLLDLRAVGLYSVAYGFSEILMLLPQRLGTLYLPRVAADKAALENTQELRLSSSMVFVGTVASAVALSVIAPPAIRFFYGSAFGDAVIPFLLLLPGICALAVGGLQATYLCGVGKVSVATAASGFALLLNVLLNLVLIPLYGVAGAAVASSLTYSAQALLLIAAVSRLTNDRPWAMLSSASPAIMMGVLRRAFR